MIYMGFSKRILAAAFVALSLTAVADNVHPALPEVKRVYLLPMTSGLDQYIANWLTKAGRFEVVTDPANADAIFTDRLGPAFEQKWAELYPPPKTEDEENHENTHNADGSPRSMIDDLAAPPPPRINSFSHA